MKKKQTIGSRIFNNFSFLRKIAKTKSEKLRLKLLRNSTKDQLLSLVEVASNILSSNFFLNKTQKEKILPHAGYIRKLSRVRSEIGARKVIQKGNGAILASLLIPIISEAARILLSKSNS
jgi:hypothetical protein